MISFKRFRKVGAVFLGIISILIIVFCSWPQILPNTQSNKNLSPLFLSGFANPIVYCKTSESLSYTDSLPKNQIVLHQGWGVTFDLFALELATSKALFVVVYLRNVFYVLTSINAP